MNNIQVHYKPGPGEYWATDEVSLPDGTTLMAVSDKSAVDAISILKNRLNEIQLETLRSIYRVRDLKSKHHQDIAKIEKSEGFAEYVLGGGLLRIDRDYLRVKWELARGLQCNTI